MKKIVSVLLALAALVLSGCASAPAPVPTEAPPPAVTPVPADVSPRPRFGSLTLTFVPMKDADAVLAAAVNLPAMVKTEMARLGVDIDRVEIRAADSEAAGEDLMTGSADLGWLPGSAYALYSDDCDVLLTATRDGLSNDSADPADWNGEQNATRRDGPQVAFTRALICAAPTDYGRMLAGKVNSGEELSWEDLDGARWAVAEPASSALWLYPSLWMMERYDGRKLSDLADVLPLEGGSDAALACAAAGEADVIVCYADARIDWAEAWSLPAEWKDAAGRQGLGREGSIWDELNVIGVTDGIYNDAVAVSKASPFYTAELVDALQSCFINLINTPEGKAVFAVCGHSGYERAVDADYDSARLAQRLLPAQPTA